MLFKGKKVVDERIQKRSDELSAKMLPLVWITNAVFLAIKVAKGLPIMVCALDILCAVVGLLVWLVEEMRYGTLFVKEKDQVLKELANKARREAFTSILWIILIGECIFFYVTGMQYIVWTLAYFLTVMPACLIITIVSLKEGLLAFGSKKREVNTKKSFRFRTVIGSVIFGVLTGLDFYYKDGVFNAKGLISIPLLALGWGVPFYFLMLAMIKGAEKKADQQVKELEDGSEE